MNLLVFLAQVAPEAAQVVVKAEPGALEDKIIGPYGALFLAMAIIGALLWYIRFILWKRITRYEAKIDDLQTQSKAQSIDMLEAKSVAKEDLRKTYDGEIDELREEMGKVKSRLGKYRGLHIFWRTQAESLCKQFEQDLPRPPSDIEKTTYGE